MNCHIGSDSGICFLQKQNTKYSVTLRKGAGVRFDSFMGDMRVKFLEEIIHLKAVKSE